MVGRDELPNAVALNSSLFNAARVIGPALGGVVVATVGRRLLLRVQRGELPRRARRPAGDARRRAVPGRARGGRAHVRCAARTRRSSTSSARGGRWSCSSSSSCSARSRSTSTCCCRCSRARTLHAGPQVFGILSACFGVGALAGALVSAVAAAAPAGRRCSSARAASGSPSCCSRPRARSRSTGLLLAVTGLCFTLWTSNANSSLQLAAPEPPARPRDRPLLLRVQRQRAARRLLTGWLAARGGTELAFAVAGGVALAMALDRHGRPRPHDRRQSPRPGAPIVQR